MHINIIIKIEASDDYLYVHDNRNTRSPRYSNTLKELEEELADTTIVRVNKYTMVNIDYIRHIENDSIFIKDNEITLSPLYRPLFLKRLGCN